MVLKIKPIIGFTHSQQTGSNTQVQKETISNSKKTFMEFPKSLQGYINHLVLTY